MKGQNLTRFLSLGAMVLVCASLSFAQSAVAVVVSPHNSQSSIGMGDLRKLLIGEKRYWPDGAAVKLFTRSAGTPEHDALLKLIGMSETEYKQYWRQRIYAGEAQSEPILLPSNGMQREALQTYAGGLALVDMADLKPGMKVLKIDGKAPGESGYPLQR